MEKEFVLPSGVACTVTPFIGEDFDLLQSSGITNEEKMLQILAKRVVKIGTNTTVNKEHIKQLTQTDCTAIMIAMRNLSFARRNTITLTYSWGTKEYNFEIPIDPKGFAITYLNGASEDKATVTSYKEVLAAKTFFLQDLGKEVEYCLASIGEKSKDIQERYKLRYKREDGNYVSLETNKLTADDYLDLVELLQRAEGSIDTRAKLTNPDTGETAFIDLAKEPNFFFPLARR
jgi:hypothetical protein